MKTKMKVLGVAVVLFLGCFASPTSGEIEADSRPSSLLENEPNGPLKECLLKLESCMETSMVKTLCIVNLGKCLAISVAKCGVQCIMPSTKCAMGHLLHPVELLKCFTVKYVKCVADHCENGTSLMDTEKDNQLRKEIASFATNGPVDDIMECVIEEVECWKTTPLLEKYKCIYKTARCLVPKIQKCGITCIPPTVKCALEQIFHPLQRVKCYTETLVNCIKEKCGDENTNLLDTDKDNQPNIENLAVDTNDVVDEILMCVNEEIECWTSVPLLDKYKCILKTAKCLGPKIQACGVTCIPPTVKCALEQLFHPLQRIKCYTETLVNCIKEKCGGESRARPDLLLDTEDKQMISVDTNGPIDDIKECINEEIECWKTTPLLEKFKCIYKTARCMIPKVQKCGVTCIPPTVKCALERIFKPLERIKCYTETLVTCIKEKCGDDRPNLLLDTEDKQMISVDTNGPIDDIKECINEEIECWKTTPLLEKFKCIYKTARCMIPKVQKCGVTCIPPTVKCALERIFKPLERIKCYTETLVTCIKEKCGDDSSSKLEAKREEEEITKKILPLDSDDPILECVNEEVECWKTAPLLMKFTCVWKTARCLAAKIEKCGLVCIPPTIKCALGHLLNPIARFRCYTVDLPDCIITNCGKNATQETTNIEVAKTDVSANGGPVDECVKEEAVCLLKKPMLLKYQCVLQAGKCLYGAIKECGWPCIGQTIKCALGHLLNPIARLKCYTVDLVVCIDDHCTDYYATPKLPEATVDHPSTQLVTNELPIQKCLDEESACFHQLPLLQRFKCVIGMGECLTLSLAKCGLKCIPSAITCALSHILSPARLLKCYTSNLATCVADNCDKNSPITSSQLPAVEKEPKVEALTNLPNDLPIEKCLKEEEQCLKETALIWKFKCILKTGKCLIGGLAKCGFVCIPDTIKCALHNILRPLKRVQCYTSGLATCVKENCDEKKTTAAPPTTKQPTTKQPTTKSTLEPATTPSF